MNYYTEFIPVTLAAELARKGMKIDIVDDTVEEWKTCPDYHCETTYAEVLDWLMSEKGLVLHIWAGGDEHTKSNMVNLRRGVKNAVGEGNFHEAANAAITKALEVI